MAHLDSLLAAFENPVTAAIGCVALVPVAIWVWSVIGWMIMGEMDFLLGAIGIMAALLLGAVAMMPPDPAYSPIALAGIVGMMIVYPLAKRQLDRRAHVMIEVEQIEKAYQILSEKPENAAAMFKLADGLYLRGLVCQAVAIAEQALVSMPKSVFPVENRTVERWRREMPPAPTPLTCLQCGRKNDPSALFCETCGAQYLALYARGRWLGKGLAWKLVASWAAATVALVGLPVVVQTVHDPVAVAVLIVLQVSVVGLLLWRAFLSRAARVE